MIWLNIRNDVKEYLYENKLYFFFTVFFFIAGISCGFLSRQSSIRLYSFLTLKLFVSYKLFYTFCRNFIHVVIMYLSGFSVLCHIITVIIIFTSGCIFGAMASYIGETDFFIVVLYVILSLVRFAFKTSYIFIQVSESLKCSQKIILRRLRGIKNPLSKIEKNEYNFIYIKVLMFAIPITLIEVFLLKIMYLIL